MLFCLTELAVLGLNLTGVGVRVGVRQGVSVGAAAFVVGVDRNGDKMKQAAKNGARNLRKNLFIAALHPAAGLWRRCLFLLFRFHRLQVLLE